MITPYVTIAGKPEFERNKTGFGYMVMDIARAVGKIEQTDVLTTDTLGEGFEHENVKFLPREIGSFICTLYACLSPFLVIKLWWHYKMSSGAILRLFYYWLMSGYLKRVLKEGQYSVVHIHGCGFATELWKNVCQQCNQQLLVTLHGLNSFSDTVRLEPAGKRYERDFLKNVVNGEFTITVISTGMKKLIEKTFKTSGCKNIHVVCNSFSFDKIPVYRKEDVRSLYKLPKESKVIVCVGNICMRKNQGQIIKAFDYLNEDFASRTYILFLGGIVQPGYTIESLSSDSKWKSHFIYCGVIPKERVPDFYEQCDGIALMSLSEGFGLSLIEGMHFGKPCLSFSDVDAFEDIYNQCAMIGVDEHDDKAVAEGIHRLLSKEWNNELIIDYSRNFESEAMANNYINTYKTLLA